METKISKKSWIVLIAAVLIMLGCGMQYSWSVFSKEMINAWGWTAQQATLPYTVFCIVSAFTAFPGGLIADKSPRANVWMNAALYGGGLMICGLTKSVAGMVIGFGVMVGAAAGAICVGPIPTATKWWPANKKGLITGLGHSGTAFSGMYMSIVMNFVLQKFGISRGFRMLAIYIFVLLMALSFFMFKPPVAETADSSDDGGNRDLNWNQTIKTSAFWKLVVIYIVGGCAGHMVASQASMIAQVQCNWQAGFILSALVGMFNGVGRISFPAVSDKISVYKAFIVVYALSVVNLLLFRFYQTPALLMFGACMAGLTYGGSITLLYTSVAVEFGRKYMGRNYGLLAMAYAGSGTIGPMLGAWCVDTAGNYYLSYVIAAVLNFVAILVSINMERNYQKRIRESKQ